MNSHLQKKTLNEIVSPKKTKKNQSNDTSPSNKRNKDNDMSPKGVSYQLMMEKFGKLLTETIRNDENKNDGRESKNDAYDPQKYIKFIISDEQPKEEKQNTFVSTMKKIKKSDRALY